MLTVAYLIATLLQHSAQDTSRIQDDDNDSISEALTCTSEVSSNLSQTLANRLRLSGAVAKPGEDDFLDDAEEQSSGIYGGESGTTSSAAVAAPVATVVKVMLPPGGLVEPPPPRLAMPPPKPSPPPTPKSAIMPTPSVLACLDTHALNVSDLLYLNYIKFEPLEVNTRRRILIHAIVVRKTRPLGENAKEELSEGVMVVPNVSASSSTIVKARLSTKDLKE